MKKITLQFLFIICCTMCFGQQYINHVISTGTISNNGTVAPAGYSWSELQNNTGDLTITNSLSFHISNDTSYADDFVVPVGEAWNINSFEFFVNQLFTVNVLRVGKIYVQIWNGEPGLPTSSVIYGDMVTDRLDTSFFENQNTYLIYNTRFNAPCGAHPSSYLYHKIWKVRANMSATLNPGTYWIEFKLDRQTGQQNPNSESFFVFPSRTAGTRNSVRNNGAKHKYSSDNWGSMLDEGCPTTSNIPLDMPFNINYTLGLSTANVNFDTFRFYPNPANNEITAEWNPTQSDISVQKIAINDIRGIKIMEIPVDKTLTSKTIDISSLQKGFYFLSLIDDHDSLVNTTKIIKQ